MARIELTEKQLCEALSIKLPSGYGLRIGVPNGGGWGDAMLIVFVEPKSAPPATDEPTHLPCAKHGCSGRVKTANELCRKCSAPWAPGYADKPTDEPTPVKP